MKKFIIILIFLSITSAVSAYAYLYLVTKQGVDAVIVLVQPFATIRYQKFSNPMDGSISIRGVSVDSAIWDIRMNIESITLTLDNVLAFIEFNQAITSGKIIPKLQLEIKRAHMDLEKANIFFESKSSIPERINDRITAQGCGDIKSISDKLNSKLGYKEFDASIKLDYNYDQSSNIMDVTLDYTRHDMISNSFKVSAPNITSYSDLIQADIKVNEFQIKTKDLGYNQRLIDFCAQKSGVEPEEYVDYHLEQVQSYLNEADITLSDEIYAAYQEYLSDQATLTIGIHPISAVGLEYLDLYQPSDWPRIFGLQIDVNGTKISDLYMDWDRDTVAMSLLNTQADVEEMYPELAPIMPPKPRYKKAFVPVEFSELQNYINSPVKVKTNFGIRHSGKIIAVEQKVLTIAVSLSGGTGVLPIKINTITEVLVYK